MRINKDKYENSTRVTMEDKYGCHEDNKGSQSNSVNKLETHGTN